MVRKAAETAWSEDRDVSAETRFVVPVGADADQWHSWESPTACAVWNGST